MNKVYKFFIGILTICLLLFLGQKKLNEKEKVIETLGKQFTMNMLKMAQMEKEIAQLKGGK